MSWWVQLIACFFAALFFSVLMNQPRSTMPVSALIAVGGYAVYLGLNRSVLAYFMATIVIGVSCEMAARIMKRTATLFFTGAIIPLVPGVGLFNSMRYVVEGEYENAVSTGVFTLLAICGIALAVTITSVLFSSFVGKKAKGP